MSQTSCGRAATVLVVEDELWLRQIFEKYLTEEGYSVFTAQSGPGALAVAASTHPQFILLDILMPGMDGLATLRELRRRGERGKVIMLTGKESTGSARQAMLLGADEYITKPFNLDLIKSVLEETRSAEAHAPATPACAP
jgi:DNA-binding response OmpR family regulator